MRKIVRNNQGSVGKFSRDLGFLHEVGKFSVLGRELLIVEAARECRT
jgi:hypothetical protein